MNSLVSWRKKFKRMVNYTEADHADALLKMLEMEDPCSFSNCPSNFVKGSTDVHGNCFIDDMCKSFVGLEPVHHCPCNELGSEEAIKRTWWKLEEKGYI